MKIKIIAFGKIKENYIKDAINEYLKRITPYSHLEIVELPAIEIKDSNLTEKVLDAEGKTALECIKKDDYVITLDVKGHQISSEEFAVKTEEIIKSGVSVLVFIIGSSCGLSKMVSARANFKLSLSKMTFLHQMTRVILLEQIYRAFKIINHERYHK